MLNFHCSSGSHLTFAVVRVVDVARYGGISVRGKHITGFNEKGRTGPGLTSGGLYVIDRCFAWRPDLPARFSFETYVLVPFVSEIRPAAFLCEGYFLIINQRNQRKKFGQV